MTDKDKRLDESYFIAINLNFDNVKKQKRISHKIGILLIFITLGVFSIKESIHKDSLNPILTFAIIVLFVFSAYWRLYQFYKLEKIRHQHNRKDFIDYFDNMTFSDGLIHFVIPSFIFKPFLSKKENDIRFQINISTLTLYIAGLTFLIHPF